MVKIRLLWSIVKRTNVDKSMLIFLGCFLLGAFIIMRAEPSIQNYGDAMWYTFAACTSVGFGDFAAVTFTGRIVTVVLVLYEIFLVALVSGVVVSHYIEVIHRREKHTATIFMDKLEHLSELSRDELRELQERVKKIKL